MKYVLITGSSTGIGYDCALDLAQNGFVVFAGVRKKEDFGKFKDIKGKIIPVILDVTSDESVSSARREIEKNLNGEGLFGLVNNAGIVVSGPLEFLKTEDLQNQFNVNVVGQLTVTRAFLPLVRKAEGRIVNVGSIGGQLVTPFVGPYCASKFALRALTDSLRMELKPWDIRVSLIEPGPVATPIWEKSKSSAQATASKFPKEATELYGKALDKLDALVSKTAAHAEPVKNVSRAIRHAMMAKAPKLYYKIGKGARVQYFVSRWVPQTVLEKAITRALS